MTPADRTGKERSLERDKSLERAMLQDNPSNTQLGEINKYIKGLDKRLSIPKFTDENGYSPRRVTNMMKRNSITNSSQISIRNKGGDQSTCSSPERKNSTVLRKRNLINDYASNPGNAYDSPLKSMPASQNMRSRQREKHYNMNILKKINVDEKE